MVVVVVVVVVVLVVVVVVVSSGRKTSVSGPACTQSFVAKVLNRLVVAEGFVES